MSAADRPVVIVPAHNEAAVVAGSLTALLADAGADEFDVVVVCNGCTDDTAARATAAAERLGRPVTVLTTPVASKAAALRLAEEHVTGFPRLYLDADVTCPTATARALVAAVAAGAPLAVPTRVLDTSASTRPARAYYRGWQTLPWVADQLAGRGAYALGPRARATFGPFPDEVADDRFVTTRVPRERVVVVPEAVVVRPPARWRDVVRVRRRVYAGNRRSAAPTHDVDRRGRVAGLARTLVTSPRRIGDLAVFTATTAVAKAGVVLAGHGPVAWGHDADRGGRGAVPHPPAPTEGAAVDVVVVTYRSAGYVAECLAAVRASLADLPDARVLVVDNGSDDDVAAVVAAADPGAEVLLRGVNDGFAAGCHAGADRSTARRLLFLNPDAVVEPGAVTALLACADRYPGAGIVGGTALRDGALDARSWFGRPTLWSALCFGLGLSSLFPGTALDPESADRWDGRGREVGVVSGGFMLVERAAWDRLGGFDRDFFLYGEDADLCVRAAAAGWRPRVCPEARFRHEVGASSAGSHRLPLVLRGKVTTYRKNLPAPWGAVAAGLLVLGTGLRAAAAGLRPAGGRVAAGPAAWREAWRRRAEWRRGWDPRPRTPEGARP